MSLSLPKERPAEGAVNRAERVVDNWRRILSRPASVPALAVVGFVVIALAWNAWIGIRFERSPLFLLIPPALVWPVCALYVSVQRLTILAEILFYISLYYIFTFFSIQITYLCLSLGYPIQDTLLARLDLSLGFDWLRWAKFLQAHPLFMEILDQAYRSHFWQPFLIITVLAVTKPVEGNSELLMGLVLAALMTFAVATFVPAIGPGDALGFLPEPAPVIRALNGSPTAQVLRYTGVVTFPSFHTVMAILFAYACRNVRWLFPAIGGLNALMLISVPYSGDHYLVDMIAGAIIAIIAIFATSRLMTVLSNSRQGSRALRVDAS